MIDEELLALDTTLGEIFPQPDAWSDITDNSTDFRKDVTIEGIITHTSGLKTPYESSVAYMENILPSVNGPNHSVLRLYPLHRRSGRGRRVPLGSAGCLGGRHRRKFQYRRHVQHLVVCREESHRHDAARVPAGQGDVLPRH